MTPKQVAQVLGKCALADKRTAGDAEVVMWGELIGDLDFNAAMAAVTRYYRDNRQPMMPADVRYIVEDMTRERSAHTRPDPLGALGTRRSAPAGATSRGYLLTRFVLDGLARARRVAGGKLGREQAAALGEELMRQALLKYPAPEMVGAPQPPRGHPCARTDCRCTHGFDPVLNSYCDRGWLEVVWPSLGVQVMACRVCYPERAKSLRGSDRQGAVRRMVAAEPVGRRRQG
jgi:hypothetical protein